MRYCSKFRVRKYLLKLPCCRHWNSEKIPSLDCGDEAASWFSKYILKKDSGMRLGYHGGVYKRNLEKTCKKVLKFYKNLSNDSGVNFINVFTKDC